MTRCIYSDTLHPITHTHTHTHTRTHTHARTHTYTHTHRSFFCHVLSRSHCPFVEYRSHISPPYFRRCTHAHIHTHVHTYAHTHTHTSMWKEHQSHISTPYFCRCTHAHIHTHKVWVRWAQRSLSAGLNTWRTSAHQQQQHAHFATAIRTRRHKSAKTCAVVNWYAHTADQKRFKRNTLAVGTFLNCRQLATEWRAWKWVLLRRQRQKVGARRGAMKRVYWLLTKVCNRWREQTICRVVDRFQNRIRAAGKTVRTLRRHSFTCVT